MPENVYAPVRLHALLLFTGFARYLLFFMKNEPARRIPEKTSGAGSGGSPLDGRGNSGFEGHVPQRHRSGANLHRKDKGEEDKSCQGSRRPFVKREVGLMPYLFSRNGFKEPLNIQGGCAREKKAGPTVRPVKQGRAIQASMGLSVLGGFAFLADTDKFHFHIMNGKA